MTTSTSRRRLLALGAALALAPAAA